MTAAVDASSIGIGVRIIVAQGSQGRPGFGQGLAVPRSTARVRPRSAGTDPGRLSSRRPLRWSEPPAGPRRGACGEPSLRGRQTDQHQARGTWLRHGRDRAVFRSPTTWLPLAGCKAG